MGMHDESWCDSCGTSLPYSENDVSCGSCVADYFEKFVAKFMSYLNEYKDELKKDFEIATEVDMANYYDGAYEAVSNILTELEERFRNE